MRSARTGDSSDRTAVGFQVVGIVGDVKNDGLGKPTVAEVYLPSAVTRVETMNVVMRSSVPPATLVSAVRQAVREVDPEQPIHDVALVRHRPAIDDARARGVVPDDILCRDGGVDGVARHLRGVVVLRAPADSRDRHPSGHRRDQPRHPDAHRRWRGEDRPLWCPRWHCRRRRCGPVARTRLRRRRRSVHRRSCTRRSLSAPWPWWRRSCRRGRRRCCRRWSRFATSPPRCGCSRASASACAIRGDGGGRLDVDGDRSADRGGRRFGSPGCVVSGSDAGRARELAGVGRRAVGRPARSVRRRLSLRRAVDSGPWLSAQPAHALPAPGRVYRPGLRRLAAMGEKVPARHVAEIERLRHSGVRMAVPLRTKTDLIGVLLLGAPGARDRYTSSEKHLLRSSADVFALMIENAHLTTRAVEQEKLRKDVALAAEVQRRLLPAAPPQSTIATLAAFTLPARLVGGDYYDFPRPRRVAASASRSPTCRARGSPLRC